MLFGKFRCAILNIIVEQKKYFLILIFFYICSERKLIMTDSIINRIKGVITEMNENGDFCNVTMTCGKDATRPVNLVMRKFQFDEVVSKNKIGDHVMCQFYLVSNFKNNRWYTSAIMLNMNNVL